MVSQRTALAIMQRWKTPYQGTNYPARRGANDWARAEPSYKPSPGSTSATRIDCFTHKQSIYKRYGGIGAPKPFGYLEEQLVPRPRLRDYTA